MADKPSGSPKSRNDHMAKRKAAGLTQKDVGAEFGKHRTTVGRVLRQGYLKVNTGKDKS